MLAYDDDQVVGWAAVHPRADTAFASNRRVPHPDDLDVWWRWCIGCVRAIAAEGSRMRSCPAPSSSPGRPAHRSIEPYPVDNKGEKVDLTMAYVGTRRLFERAGFGKAADTDSVFNGFPRVLMRLDLQ